jgi:hypothetical protein
MTGHLTRKGSFRSCRFLLALLFFSGVLPPVSGAAGATFLPFVEPFPQGKVDWANGYFYGTGRGYPHLNDGSGARATKVAQARALSAILKVASGLQVDDRRVLADLENERMVIEIKALIRYELFEETWVQEGAEPFYRVTYRAPMRGVNGLTKRLLPYVKTGTGPAATGGERVPDDEGPWLVLDARNLGPEARVQPALFPKIVSAAGGILSDLHTVDEEALARRGMARYVITHRSPEEIMAGLQPEGPRGFLRFLGPAWAMAEEKTDRKRQRTYVVKDVTRVEGLAKTNLVISEADAREIQHEDAASQILKRCRVIVAVPGSLGGIEGGVPTRLARSR